MGNRLQLIFQFLGETGIITLLALTGSLIVVLTCLPLVNNLLQIHLSTSVLFSAKFVLFLILALLAVTFLSGFYPALVLSGFKAINVLKSAVSSSNKGISFRRGLVVFQFVIAQTLIIGTLIIASQMDYFRNEDMGFAKNAIINASFQGTALAVQKLYFCKMN